MRPLAVRVGHRTGLGGDEHAGNASGLELLATFTLVHLDSLGAGRVGCGPERESLHWPDPVLGAASVMVGAHFTRVGLGEGDLRVWRGAASLRAADASTAWAAGNSILLL